MPFSLPKSLANHDCVFPFLRPLRAFLGRSRISLSAPLARCSAASKRSNRCTSSEMPKVRDPYGRPPLEPHRARTCPATIRPTTPSSCRAATCCLLVECCCGVTHGGVPAVALAPLEANPFPDATPEFFAAYEAVVNRAVGGAVRVLLPYRGLPKMEVLRRGRDVPLELTFSCIRPVAGRHCGRCNKCAGRRWDSPSPEAEREGLGLYIMDSRLRLGGVSGTSPQAPPLRGRGLMFGVFCPPFRPRDGASGLGFVSGGEDPSCSA